MAKTLKETLADLIPKWREERTKLVKEYGEFKISDVNIAQAIGGMRGVKGMVCDTSVVEPDQGLIVRGIPIGKLTDKLPEEIFWLLCTGKLPTADELKGLQKEFRAAGEVPPYVIKVLKAMPKTSHPMAMLDTGVLVMENESQFRARYTEGMKKDVYWEPALEDSIRLLGAITGIAAAVYRIKYFKGDLIELKKKEDWGADYAKMLGLPPHKGDTAKMMRLYLTLHCDHEGGNVSAFTSHTVGSALSDPYYAVSAGLNGLAGPLHGLANQECLAWVLETMEKFGGAPSEEEIRNYAWETLNSGKVIPGYGHAVLRVTDPRFTAFIEFGKKHLPKNPVFQTVNRVFDVVPDVLRQHGKAKNPWPNVDAGSGAILYAYDLTQTSYYTVLFSVSRAMGMLSQLVLNRALGTAITRPKSVSTEWLYKQVKKESVPA